MAMVAITRPFGSAQYLGDDEAVADYLSEALESGDASFIADSLGHRSASEGAESGRQRNEALTRDLNQAFGSDCVSLIVMARERSDEAIQTKRLPHSSGSFRCRSR